MLKIVRLFICLSFSLWAVASMWNAGNADLQREALVKSAKGGDLSAAIHGMEELLLQYPGDMKVRSDLIILMGWSGDAAGFRLFEKDPGLTYPDYALS